MLIIASTAKAIKNRFAFIRAMPVKYKLSERKNGFRDRAKMPVVTSVPELFSSRSKRSDVLKWNKVMIHKTNDNNIIRLPIICNSFESIQIFKANSGKIEYELKNTG